MKAYLIHILTGHMMLLFILFIVCGGFFGLYVLTAILAAILGILIYYANVKLTKNNLVSFLITLGVLFFMRDYIAARAQLVTFILFIMEVFFIEKFLETKYKRYAIGLIIIPIIIANVHAAVWWFYFILYLPYIAEYLISLMGNLDLLVLNTKIKSLNKKILKEESASEIEKTKETIKKLETKKTDREIKKTKFKENAYKIKVAKNNNTKWLILILVICLLTGLITPVFGEPYTHIIRLMSGNTTQFINEHQPLTLINNIEFMSILLLYILILMFTDTKIKLSDLLMTAGLLLLALKTRRQVSMFLLIGTIIFNRLICTLLAKYDRDGCRKLTRLMTTFVGRIITIIIVFLLGFAIINDKLDDSFLEKGAYPIEAANYIKENLDLENIRLYNEYNYGSYLVFSDIPVFIDSRADLYTPQFNGNRDIFSDFIDTNNIGVYYEETMGKYDITHVLLYKGAKLTMFLSRDKNYKEIYSDDFFVIYERGK